MYNEEVVASFTQQASTIYTYLYNTWQSSICVSDLYIYRPHDVSKHDIPVLIELSKLKPIYIQHPYNRLSQEFSFHTGKYKSKSVDYFENIIW